jgi:hypothetical protein
MEEHDVGLGGYFSVIFRTKNASICPGSTEFTRLDGRSLPVRCLCKLDLFFYDVAFGFFVMF